MREEVSLDVVRTFPKEEFFKLPETQEILTEVLMVWSLQHPNIGYRQGLNELLALILLVVYGEQVTQPSADDAGVCLQQLNHPDYVRHDSYILFDCIMGLGVQDLFLPPTGYNNSLSKLMTIDNPLRARYTGQDLRSSKILQICNRVFHEHLKVVDNELYEHLCKLNIDPHMFLL